jgi:hypothetical protein
VVIEFGHNDGGSLSTDDGRTDCPGQSTEVCYSVYDGVNETIYTFPEYMIMASQLYLASGASVILSTFTWDPNRFQYYDWLVPNIGILYRCLRRIGGQANMLFYQACDLGIGWSFRWRLLRRSW